MRRPVTMASKAKRMWPQFRKNEREKEGKGCIHGADGQLSQSFSSTILDFWCFWFILHSSPPYIYFIDRYHTTEYNLTSIVVVATANLQLQAMADPIKTLGQLGQRCLPLLDKLFHGPCMFLLLPWLTCSWSWFGSRPKCTAADGDSRFSSKENYAS